MADPDSPVLVDFDHTLFASNSTELFISRCRPSWAAAVVDLLVRGCVPWRLWPGGRGPRIRDYVCVVLLVVLMPWNLPLWRRAAPALYERHRVQSMSTLLADVDRTRLTVISFGMGFVIRALLRGSELEQAAVLATPALPRRGWFAPGKVTKAVAHVGEDGVRRAVFVSDSLHDADLLMASRSGFLVPQQGESVRARERLYIPMRYTARVKVSPWFTLDQLFLVDSVVLVLAVAYDLTSLLHLLLVAPLLLLSVMSVYELGYFENDMHAARSEARPRLGADVARFRDYPIHVQAWVWSAAFAAAGLVVAVALDELGTDDLLVTGCAWVLLLVAVRAVFYGYNRSGTQVRILVYPVLQVLKYGSVTLVFVPSLLGVVLVLSQVTAMWVTYVVYRLDGRKEGVNRDLVRTAVFLAGSALLGVATLLHGGLLDAGPGAGYANLVCFTATLVWSLARATKAPVTRRVRAWRASRT